MSTVKNTTQQPLDLPDGRMIPPGRTRDRVELADPHVAARLIGGSFVHVPVPGEEDEREPTVPEIAELVAAAESTEELDRLLAVENARQQGARKGVLAAIDRRRDELDEPNTTEETDTP